MTIGTDFYIDTGFRCPICGFTRYYKINVLREGKPPHYTDFFACDGCSVMFTDPRTFTADREPPRDRTPYFKTLWMQPPKLNDDDDTT